MCQCELVAMRKTRGGAKHKTGDRQERQKYSKYTQRSVREREERKREEEVIKKLSKE